jgi:predicted nucleotidyltransferase
MDKDEVIRLMQEHSSVLMNEYGISKIGIFGSVVKGTMTEDSDLDIVVEFKKPIGFKFNRLVEYLENLFGRKVDVLTKDGIKNIRVKEVARNIERTLVYV